MPLANQRSKLQKLERTQTAKWDQENERNQLIHRRIKNADRVNTGRSELGLNSRNRNTISFTFGRLVCSLLHNQNTQWCVH